MTDGQTLFAVFALLYLVECLRLVPSSAWMAAGSGKARWSTIRPWSRFQIGGGSPLLLVPLPPMQAHTLALPFDLVPETDALKVSLGDGVIIRIIWPALSLRVEDAMLHLDATTRLRFSSKAHAERWKKRLNEWSEMQLEKRRNAFLKFTCARLNPKSAAASANAAATRTRSLRMLATLHFITCFGGLTAVYRRYGDSVILLVAAGLVLLLQFTQAWLFLRSTRSMRPLIPHRRWRALGIAFLPQLTMRAADAASLADEDEPPHPLAWRGMINDTKWLSMARTFWREARYVPGWSRSETVPLEAEALHAFFKQEGIADADYDPPPAANLPACPRCGAEFQAGVTLCQDCSGVELRQPVA